MYFLCLLPYLSSVPLNSFFLFLVYLFLLNFPSFLFRLFVLPASLFLSTSVFSFWNKMLIFQIVICSSSKGNTIETKINHKGNHGLVCLKPFRCV